MSKSSFKSMSDDELWHIFKDVAETLTERMAAEKHELVSRLERLDDLLVVKRTDEIDNRQPYKH